MQAAGDDELGDFARYSQRYFELLQVAHERYGEEVTFRDLIYASLQGMTRGLDPHTQFLPPRSYDTMQERQKSHIFGIGILVGTRDGRITVITPVEGTPAHRAGVQAGDIIDSVEGESTENMPLDEAISKIKGPKGTEVHITILRRSLEEPLALTISRAEIPQTTVRQAYMLTPGTGYLRVTTFSRSTGAEVAQAVAKLRGLGMKQLVLDLRNNGGGLLDQAIAVSEQFVPRGSKVVDTRGRIPSSLRSFRARGSQTTTRQWDLPMVVLVNRGTASAAEIVSGAVQDHDVGLVVGTTTWGKGLVQTVYNLCNRSGLALTTASYYTPSGRQIQRDYSSFYDYYAVRSDADSDSEGETEPAAETFATSLGRQVLGGGGITPDVEVEAPPASAFEQRLLVRNAFAKFAVDYQSRHGTQGRDFDPGPEVEVEFRQWLVDEEVAKAEEVEEGLAKEDTPEYIRRQIQAEVLNTNFGQEAWHRALAAVDPQIQRALELLPQAAELLAQRRARWGRSAPSSGKDPAMRQRPGRGRRPSQRPEAGSRPSSPPDLRDLDTGRLLVSSMGMRWDTYGVQRHDAETGTLLDRVSAPGRAGRLGSATGMTLGPDGDFYVAVPRADAVLRYDGASGDFVDVFVSQGSGGLVGPSALTHGPDGDLYVAGAHGVLRYNGQTGAFVQVFARVRTPHGLAGIRGLAFGPGGHLYVASEATGTVLRYDGRSGQPRGTFVASEEGGLDRPYDIVFGPDGDLYVASFCRSSVLRYDGITGEPLGAFVAGGSGGLVGPTGLVFGPDGHLYVASGSSGGVLRYDGATGNFLDAFIQAGEAPEPFDLIFTPRRPRR